MRCLQPLALVCALVAGCLTARPEVVVSNYETGAPTDAATPEAIDLYVALAERPVGDRYLNRGLWEFADEQSPFQHDLERKALIDQNGFRVGLLGSGSPDGAFLKLLSGRNCPDPRCIRIFPGNTTTLDIGGVWSSLMFQLARKNSEERVTLTQAQCRFQVLAHLDGDSRVRLVVTPNVIHGAQQAQPQAVQDPDGSRRWDMRMKRPEEVYPWLGWTLTLGPGEVAILGGQLDRAESLGRQMFLYTQTDAPLQRVLVLRALRTGGPAKPREGAGTLATRAQEVPLLGGSKVRGSAPE